MFRAPYLKLTKPYYAVLSPNNLKYNIFNANFRIINRKVVHYVIVQNKHHGTKSHTEPINAEIPIFFVFLRVITPVRVTRAI